LPPLEVYILGMVPFRDLQRLQRRIVYDLGEQPGAVLILCEHPPTISVGRSGSWAHIAADLATLQSLGIEVHWVNRGGGCVLHAPGQLVGYLAAPLGTLGLNLQQYLVRLNQAIVDVLAEFDLAGAIRPDFSGVDSGYARIATTGVAVSRDIVYHGFTMNVGPYLDLFQLLAESADPLHPGRQTSMESRRRRPAPMPRVKEAVVRAVERAFGLEQHHFYTNHPLLRRGEARPAHVVSRR